MSAPKSNLYALLKPLVKIGARLYCRKIEVVGVEHFPKDKPVILVANHQNAMLDPVLLCLFLEPQLHWLTRADIFKKPTANKWLRKLNMLPVYRERDKVEDLHGINQKTFDEANARLIQGSVLCVFPEGTHRGRKQLIPLKKGVARMTLNAINSGVQGLTIVPVGLDYEDFYGYHGALLIRIGKPIQLEPFSNKFEDQSRIQNALLAAVKKSLQDEMIDVPETVDYDLVMDVEQLAHKVGARDLNDGFQLFKKWMSDLAYNPSRFEASKLHLEVYSQGLKKGGFEERYIQTEGSGLLTNFLIGFLLPIALPALIWFYPLYALTEGFVKSKIKDLLFRNSIRLCFWTFLAPLWLVLGASAVTAFTSWYLGLIFGGIFTLSGLVAIPWLRLRRKVVNQMRFSKLAPADRKAWLAARSALIESLKVFS